MRILVVEDKKKIGEYIKKGLSENGFNVDVAEEGETGSHLACTENYDLIILDVMLLHRDGWPIVKAMRAKGNQMPVLLLTALDKVEDRVKGLEQGGDDYLVKPFASSEQLARPFAFAPGRFAIAGQNHRRRSRNRFAPAQSDAFAKTARPDAKRIFVADAFGPADG